MSSSSSFRTGLRDGDRYRFLASCCVIVLPPRIRFPVVQLSWNDFSSSSKSTPSCEKNAASSATMTARLRAGEICS